MGKTAMQGIRLLLVISMALSTWQFPVLEHPVAVAAPLPLTMAALSDLSGDDGFTPVWANSLSPLPGPTIQEADGTLDFEDVVQRLQQLTPLFQELYSHLDRSQFDLDDLSTSLGYDAGAIIDFVRSEIAFEQYPGVLRGEFGTLIGRAGNAADQALLLRRLLEDAGYETRIARGTLSEVQAASLVDQMAVPRSVPPPAIDQAVIDRVLNQLQVLNGEPVATTTDSPTLDPYQFYLDATENDTQVIFNTLAAANIQLGDDGFTHQVIEEARDYFWVQYRVSAFEPWLDAHPAFTDAAAAPAEIAIEETYRDALPENLYHRFRLEVFIEQKQADTLVVHPLLTGWERTSAELVGTPLTFRNQPNNFDFQTTEDLETLLANAKLFLPVVSGELADKAFDLDGYPFGAAVVGPGTIEATALIQSAAGTLEDVTGALGDLGGTQSGDPDDLITLTAQWIEYTLIAPDGRETTTRRYVMDRVGSANREQGVASISEGSDILEASKALFTEHIIMVIPTHYSDAYRSERFLTGVLKVAELLSDLRDSPDLDPLPTHLMEELVPLHDVSYDVSLDFSSSSESGLVSYLPEPMLVVYQDGLVPGRPEDTGFERVDVINNTRRVLSTAGGVIQPAPMEAVRQGVWETYAERVLIRDASSAPFNTFSALADADANAIPLLVLSPGDTNSVAALTHSEQTRADVQRDLDAGYIVIIPERSAAGSGVTGWWRIDPLTGETLGITAGGYGSQLVEYAITVAKIGFAWWSTRYKCLGSGGGTACCLAFGVLAGTTGLPTSFLVQTIGSGMTLYLYALYMPLAVRMTLDPTSIC